MHLTDHVLKLHNATHWPVLHLLEKTMPWLEPNRLKRLKLLGRLCHYQEFYRPLHDHCRSSSAKLPVPMLHAYLDVPWLF